MYREGGLRQSEAITLAVPFCNPLNATFILNADGCCKASPLLSALARFGFKATHQILDCLLAFHESEGNRCERTITDRLSTMFENEVHQNVRVSTRKR